MENTNTPTVVTIHLFRFSDRNDKFCGTTDRTRAPHSETCNSPREKCNCQVKVDCEDCKAAKAAKRASQSEAAKRVIAAQAVRESQFGDFEIYD